MLPEAFAFPVLEGLDEDLALELLVGPTRGNGNFGSIDDGVEPEVPVAEPWKPVDFLTGFLGGLLACVTEALEPFTRAESDWAERGLTLSPGPASDGSD